MKNAWLIPLVGAIICWMIAGVALVQYQKGTVDRKRMTLLAGQSTTLTNLQLEKDRLHTLKISPIGGLRENDTIDLSAALVQGDNVLFEVSDSYWHLTGVWREGGESGTWREMNTETEFEFRVPESGTYDLEISVDGTSGGAASIQADVAWDKPWVLSFWPLALGGLLLFGGAGWTAMRTGRNFARSLMELGPGSKIKVGDAIYTITDRMEHWESLERVGVDFRCRDAIGAETWLSISSWWMENPMDDDHGTTVWQVFSDVRFTPDEQTMVNSATPGGTSIMVKGMRFVLDRDNSGGGTLATERDGEVYISNYYNWAYRSTHSIPRQPGEMWLECTQWRDGRDSEWSLSKLLDWKVVDVEEENLRELLSIAQVDKAKRGGSADPFGVRQQQQQFSQSNQQFVPPGASAPPAKSIPVHWQPPTAQQQQTDEDSEAQQQQQTSSKDPYDWN